jgi:hypothetical protein
VKADWPKDVAAALERHEVVAITSGITDLREAEALLEDQLPGRWQRIEWGMGSAANRAHFHDLQEVSGFHMLPMFIGRDGVIGGLTELRGFLQTQGQGDTSQPSTRSGNAPAPLLHLLGYAGLIPFVVFGAAAWLGSAHWQAFSLHALGVYGAVILSFLGAVHWGLFLLDRSHQVLGQPAPIWAVIPSVAAWAALLMPMVPGLTVLLLLFPLVLWVDHGSLRRFHLPSGYIQLRGYLTLGGTLSLLSGIFAALTV